MSDSFDRESWERRWSAALADGAHAVSAHAPNAYLLAEAAELAPGRALDAGAGHGAETLWLASRGWAVTAVDFSAVALEHARGTAQALGAEVAERVEWVEADLGVWAPASAAYELVACLFVHVAGSVEDMVRRLACGVAPGGTLLLAGYQPVEPKPGDPSPAVGQTQVSVAQAVAALDPERWQVRIAEDRPRTSGPAGVDAVVLATRRI